MRRCTFGAIFASAALTGTLAALGQTSADLRRIGGISAENGEFAFLGDRVTAYSDRNISVLTGASERPSLVATEGGAVSFQVKASSLMNVPNIIPGGVSHEFPLCDSFDQISKPVEKSISAALPKDAKVKSTEDLIDGRVLVAYSMPGGEFQKLELALFDGSSDKGYVLTGKASITDYGDYCGMLGIATRIRAVLVDEPAGSSDSRAVYFFAIPEKPKGKQ